MHHIITHCYRTNKRIIKYKPALNTECRCYPGKNPIENSLKITVFRWENGKASFLVKMGFLTLTRSIHSLKSEATWMLQQVNDSLHIFLNWVVDIHMVSGHFCCCLDTKFSALVKLHSCSWLAICGDDSYFECE